MTKELYVKRKIQIAEEYHEMGPEGLSYALDEIKSAISVFNEIPENPNSARYAHLRDKVISLGSELKRLAMCDRLARKVNEAVWEAIEENNLLINKLSPKARMVLSG